jgi:hypothetical protein
MKKINRRRMLMSAGSTVALPLLPSLSSGTVFAREAATPPKRLIFLNTGYGPSNDFFPDITDTGAGFALTKPMKVLAKHRDNFSFLSHLSNHASTRYNPHAGATTFLTSVNPSRTPGRAFHNAISCDQVAAAQIGKDVRYASLELKAAGGGGEGTGMSLAWNAQGKSLYGESDPTKLFHRLFASAGSSVEATRTKIQHERSVLDAVLVDAKSLSKKLSAEDKAKTEEYFDLVRNIEIGLSREDKWLDRPKPKSPYDLPAAGAFTGTPGALMMFDLMTSALQTGATRVITYQLPVQGLLDEFAASNGGGRIAHHRMTHYGTKDTREWESLVHRDHKLCELYGALLDRLASVKESDGSSLLDNTLVVMGSDLRTGHTRKNVAILLGGGRAGGIQQGHHRVYKEGEGRLSDLWLSMLQFAGCGDNTFADSTGGLSDLCL